MHKKEQVRFSRRRTPRKYIAQYTQEEVGISRERTSKVVLRNICKNKSDFPGGFFQVFTRTPTIFQENIPLRTATLRNRLVGCFRKNAFSRCTIVFSNSVA